MPAQGLVLLACFLLGTFATAARGQTALVDNRASSNPSGDPLDSPGLASAHAFTTGAADYRLHSVSVNLKLYNASNVAVKLWSGSGRTPVAMIEDLGTVSNAPAGTSNVLFTSVARPPPRPEHPLLGVGRESLGQLRLEYHHLHRQLRQRRELRQPLARVGQWRHDLDGHGSGR